MVCDQLIDVQVAMVMRIDDVWLQIPDDRLKALDDLGDGKAIEPVIAQSKVKVL